jgi:tetratricopeptide (TPR) repeat protein
MTVTVTSNPPDANVTLITKAGARQLGKTPLSLDADQLGNVGDGFTLEIAKDGHFQQRVVIEKRSLSSAADVNVKLAQHPKFDFKKNDPDVKATIEQIVRNISSVQSMLVKRDYNQAEVLTKALLNEYPNLAVGWTLLGNTYYLQGRYDEAATHYQKALEIEPQNQETRDMLGRMNRAPAESPKER